MKRIIHHRSVVLFLIGFILIFGGAITAVSSYSRPPIATYPTNQDYGQMGDFIGKRAVDAGRSAIMSTIGPVLILLPESPGSSDAHVDLQLWDSSWNLSDLSNPQFLRYVNCFEGVCRNGHAQHAHATHTNFQDGEAYLWTNNYWELGNSHRYDPVTGDTVPETPFWQAYAGRLYSPFYMSDFWSYSAPFDSEHTIFYTYEPGPDWRGHPLATWDHLGDTGVTGFFSFHGDLMVVASDQASTGMAIYSMNGWQDGITGSFQPQLLSVYQPTVMEPDGSTIGIGGYWAEPYGANKMVWSARTNGTVGRDYPAMYVVDFTDPTNPELTCELYFNQDTTSSADGDNMIHPMYVNFQDQYAYVDNMKVDIDLCESIYAQGKAGDPNFIISGTDMTQVAYRLPTMQNYCDGSQYFRPLGQVGVFGGIDRYGSEAIITYTGPELIEGSYSAGVYAAYNYGNNRTMIGDTDVQVGDVLGGGRQVTSVEIDERMNTQGICFFVTSDDPDTNPPYISGHRPLANSTNVAADTFISIHIPETVRTETAVSAFTLTNIDSNETVGFRHRLTHTGTFTLWPDDDLEVDASYRVDVTGIQDYMGNEMTPYSFTFTTGETLPPPPPDGSDWIHCAYEDETCTVPETAIVRYGVPGAYNYIEGVTDTVECDNATFGDPAPGQAKTCAYWAGETAPDFGGTPYYPNQSSQISCQPETVSNNLWVVNPDNDTVSIINTSLEPGSLHPLLDSQQEIDLNYRKPTSVTQIGSWMAITYQDDDIVAFVDSNGTLDFTVNTGYGSQPVASITNGTSLFVSLFGSGEVVEINPNTQAVINRLEVGPDPKAMALNGDRLLVTRFISPMTHAELYDIDISTGLQLTRTILINKVLVNDALDHGSGVPNFLSSVVFAADGERAFITAVKANIDRGTSSARNGIALDDDNTVRPMMVEIDLLNNQDANVNPNTPDGTHDFDNAADPAGVTYLVDGESRMVTFQGNNVVMGVNENLSTFTQFSTGFAPQEMCSTLRVLYVKNFTGRSVSAVDVSGYMDSGERNPAILTINTVSNERFSSEELEGLRQFYHSSIPEMGAEGYMSCASCHAGGGQDGMVWDITSLGEGLRNTLSLNGTSGTRFGELHWSSNFDEVQDFELQIEELNGGTGLIDGQTFNGESPLHMTTSGQSTELDALAAYVSSLGIETVSRSPYRTESGELTAAALRGQQVFNENGCAACHAGSAFRDGQNHDVGTITDTSGTRIFGPLTEIRTPTLIELWETAPYFHDGSADTLSDVFTVGTHAITFTGTEEADLIEFLLSIDESMFIGDDEPFQPAFVFDLWLPLIQRN
ncbi:MAG: Ig-like domain-containing protein [Chloroflexota bacterium]